MRWQKSPDNEDLRQGYQQLKKLSRKCEDKAREEWWEGKV